MQSQPAPKPRCVLAFDCLIQYGLRDAVASSGQFCIHTRLATGRQGDERKELCFRGSGRLPFGAAIRPV